MHKGIAMIGSNGRILLRWMCGLYTRCCRALVMQRSISGAPHELVSTHCLRHACYLILEFCCYRLCSVTIAECHHIIAFICLCSEKEVLYSTIKQKSLNSSYK